MSNKNTFSYMSLYRFAIDASEKYKNGNITKEELDEICEYLLSEAKKIEDNKQNDFLDSLIKNLF